MTKEKLFEIAAEKYKATLWENAEAMNYLVKERGLSTDVIDQFNLGLCSGQISELAKGDKDIEEAAIKASLIIGERDALEGYIVFPIYSNSTIMSFYGRNFNSPSTKPHMLLKDTNKSVLYNQAALSENAVVVNESPIDALTLVQHGFNALSVMGSCVSKESVKLFAGKTVYILFDNDSAGASGSEKTADRLLGTAKSIHILSFGCKYAEKVDVNSYFIGVANAVDRIKFMVKFSSPISKTPIPKKEKRKIKKVKNIERIEDDISIVEIGKLLFGDYKMIGENEMWVRCPHHKEGTEKNFSLKIGGNKNIFYCFGCNTGGGPISLVKWHFGISFIEALKWFKEHYDIDLLYE
ncbi:CHC2 zinc finger domain-containing protein [Candidatus Dojkabacteria bacterium]|jgi:DNA primase|nr:CHC2 zinc finger domain-containing protein [Candidatus Dojkabacteria bacterium]